MDDVTKAKTKTLTVEVRGDNVDRLEATAQDQFRDDDKQASKFLNDAIAADALKATRPARTSTRRQRAA